MTEIRQRLEHAARVAAEVKDVDAAGADLAAARLVRLKGDFVRFDGANLRDAQLSFAHLMDCDLVGADLTGAWLNSAVLWQCKFVDAVAEGLNLAGARITIGWFSGARLAGATLRGAELVEVDFYQADLAGADLTGVRCAGPGTDFQRADLRGANFTKADLTGANLRKALLDGAIFAGAVLTGAQFDGHPPDTGTLVYSWDGLLTVLDNADPERARRWWRDRPADYYTYGTLGLSGRINRSARDARFDRPTLLALFDEVLLTDDQVALHEATEELGRLGRHGWDLSGLVPSLVRLLGRPRGPVISRESGLGRRTADPGREAAVRLGTLAADGDAAAMAALDEAMRGKADMQRHGALGLALAYARSGDWAALDRLLASPQPRIRAAGCDGVAQLASDALGYERGSNPSGTQDELAPWDVPAARQRAVALMDDPAAPVRKAALDAMKAATYWAGWSPFAKVKRNMTPPDQWPT
jgi:uncharacterized protein YjbI with pentapeptide repeats